MYSWKRTVRTPNSERFLVIRDGQEAASVDLHYTAAGAAGTVILFESAAWKDDEIPHLLSTLDEDLLPGVALAEGSLTFTVVTARILGNFEAHSK